METYIGNYLIYHGERKSVCQGGEKKIEDEVTVRVSGQKT